MKTLKLNENISTRLNRLKNMPKSLSYEGVDPNILVDRPIVAVVGTRKPTPYGKNITEKIVSKLSREGVVIVSGLAFGIDILAHKVALDNGGVTISVLPSGINNIYPASHKKIAEQITENGCLISEYEASRKPRKSEFLERNRIIAALSDAVIIPEAAQHSGSLNTASHARRMDIPIFCSPR